MVSFTTILLLLLRANPGDITYYNTGLGACGWFNNDDEYVVAVSASLFDAQSPCGRDIRVVDRCGGCAFGDVDLSPRAFIDLVGSLHAGRVQGFWDFAQI